MAVASLSHARIAVVSGNELFLHQLRKLLVARREYELLAVDEWSGADAAVAALQPDVVVIDLSGDEEAARLVLEGLTCNVATQHLPVVALAGANRVVPLPAGSQELVILEDRFGELLRRVSTVLAIHQWPAVATTVA